MIVFTKQRYESIYAAFQHAEFSTYADFCAGEHAQRLKMQKLASLKPALSIREVNSSHLRDICNAISTKYRAK